MFPTDHNLILFANTFKAFDLYTPGHLPPTKRVCVIFARAHFPHYLRNGNGTFRQSAKARRAFICTSICPDLSLLDVIKQRAGKLTDTDFLRFYYPQRESSVFMGALWAIRIYGEWDLHIF